MTLKVCLNQAYDRKLIMKENLLRFVHTRKYVFVSRYWCSFIMESTEDRVYNTY